MGSIRLNVALLLIILVIFDNLYYKTCIKGHQNLHNIDHHYNQKTKNSVEEKSDIFCKLETVEFNMASFKEFGIIRSTLCMIIYHMLILINTLFMYHLHFATKLTSVLILLDCKILKLPLV